MSHGVGGILLLDFLKSGNRLLGAPLEFVNQAQVVMHVRTVGIQITRLLQGLPGLLEIALIEESNGKIDMGGGRIGLQSDE